MGSFQEIMRLARPFLKGWYILAVCVGIALGLGYRSLYYAIPTYQTSAALKLNDKESGASKFLKNFEEFAITGQLLGEVEVLRSKYLISKALDKLDVWVMYYRFERTLPRNLYANTPFRVEHDLQDSSLIGKFIRIKKAQADGLSISFMQNGQLKQFQASWGQKIETEGFWFVLHQDSSFHHSHPDGMPEGEYAFVINDKRHLMREFADHNLIVNLPEKEVPIIHLYYTHEVPQMAADVVNILAETYIEDFIENKKKTATKALNFIDDQIGSVEKQLRDSEEELANFKAKSKVVDLAMETDAKLKQISELELRKLNSRLRLIQLQSLRENIQRDSIPSSLRTNYESIQDPTFTDALLKIQTLKTSKNELLQKYTPEYPEVIQVEEEMARVRELLLGSVDRTILAIQANDAELERSLKALNTAFAALPDVEKDLLVLKRQFLTNEQVYGFLLKKRAEAAIGAASTISFHTVLQRAPIPKATVSPQKTITLGIAGLIGMIIGVIIILAIRFLKATVYYQGDIEALVEAPVIGVVKRVPKELELVSQDFINLTTNIHLIQEVQLLSVGAYTKGSARNLAALNLAKGMAGIGYKTCLVDTDLYASSLHEYFELPNQIGLTHLIMKQKQLEEVVLSTRLENLDLLPSGMVSSEIPTRLILNPNMNEIIGQLREQYDRIILNVPYLEKVRDAIPLMKQSEVNLLIAKSDKTRTVHIKESEELLRRFFVPNIYYLLIQGQNQREQATYLVHEGKLPPMGKGTRRLLIKDLLKFIFLKHPMPSYGKPAKMGLGTRRKMVKFILKQILKR
ncbi:MAG: GNVR domain-containing protein [Bacteroidota bacterium]